MSQDLVAVVEKPRAQAAIGSLRAEGVYDDSRSTVEADDGTVAIPVTEPPVGTEILEMARQTGQPRFRTLEDHLRERGWGDEAVERAPGSWAVVGRVVLVDFGDLSAAETQEVGEALLAMHGGADTVLAREGSNDEHREPSVEVVAGEGDTETVHREHGTEYALDLSTVMFSPGSRAERARMGELVGDGCDEPSGGPGGEATGRVLDTFAGVGQFTLPMARAGARVTAVERTPAAFQYLLENTLRNGVTDRVAAYRGDCRDVVPALDGDFDRVVMGYYEAHEYLGVTLDAVAPGGVLHMHEATPESLVPDRPVGRLEGAADRAGRGVEVLGVRDMRGYSEGVRHVVVDARVG
jgi:tRNA wybutosine-synthesizing protein 2